MQRAAAHGDSANALADADAGSTTKLVLARWMQIVIFLNFSLVKAIIMNAYLEWGLDLTPFTRPALDVFVKCIVGPVSYVARYINLAVAHLLVAFLYVIARLEAHLPDAVGTFVDLGRGLVVFAYDGIATTIGHALLAYLVLIDRLHTYLPDCARTFGSLGLGLAVAAYDAMGTLTGHALVGFLHGVARVERFLPDAAKGFADIARGLYDYFATGLSWALVAFLTLFEHA